MKPEASFLRVFSSPDASKVVFFECSRGINFYLLLRIACALLRFASYTCTILHELLHFEWKVLILDMLQRFELRFLWSRHLVQPPLRTRRELMYHRHGEDDQK